MKWVTQTIAAVWLRQVAGDTSACLQLLHDVDFVQRRDFYLGDPAMVSQYHSCVDRVQRYPSEKTVSAGGVHYPVLIVNNHVSPSLSYDDPVNCWVGGYTGEFCCPDGGNPECWDGDFTYDMCCRGQANIHRAKIGHFFVVPAMDMNVGSSVKNYGSFAPQQAYAMQAFCQPGAIVLDVGANIGGFTLGFAERVGKTGKVYAFEPFHKTFQMLTANVALNGLSNVYTKHVAIGNVSEDMWLYGPDMTQFNVPSAMQVFDQPAMENSYAEQHITYEKEKELIEVRTLDQFGFQDLAQGSITFIKIDVEDMETAVALGGRETIAYHKPVIWAENVMYFEQDNTEFVDTMRSELRYDCNPVEHHPLEMLCYPIAAA